MIHLHIKGDMHAAFKAADARKIELTSIACIYRKSGIPECVASTKDELRSQVQAWFCENTEMIEGYGHPAGTLLFYNDEEAAHANAD
jgi:hypothetical protein